MYENSGYAYLMSKTLMFGLAIRQTMFGQSKGYPITCRSWQREIERTDPPAISSKNIL